VKQQDEIKALPDNQVRMQPKTPDSYRAITKALNEKNTTFHTYKLKDERNYRVVLKNMHYSINLADMQTEIEKLGTTRTQATETTPANRSDHKISRINVCMLLK
jgi:hypothetical protein